MRPGCRRQKRRTWPNCRTRRPPDRARLTGYDRQVADSDLTFVFSGPRLDVVAAQERASEGPWTVLTAADRHSEVLAKKVLALAVAGREISGEQLPPIACTVVVHNSRTASLEVVTSASAGGGLVFSEIRASPRADAVPSASGSVDDRNNVHGQRSWAMSSRMMALLALMPGKPELDESRLAGYLLVSTLEPPYRGVEALGRGRRLVMRATNDPRISQWLQLDQDPVSGLVEDFVAQYCEAIDHVMDATLPLGGDVSALMSGGLDSTMVVGTAAMQMGAGRRINAMCSDPWPAQEGTGNRGSWLYTDLPDALSMAQMWPNVEVCGLRNVDNKSPLDTLPHRFNHTGLPIMNPSNSVWIDQAVRRAQERGHHVVLAGLSGNMTFSYEPPDAYQRLLARGQVGSLIGAMRARSAATGSPMWREAARLAPPSVLRSKARMRLRRSRGRQVPAGNNQSLIRPEAIERLQLGELVNASPFSGSSQGQARRGPGPRDVAEGLSVGWSPLGSVRICDPLDALPLISLVSRLPAESFVGIGPGRSFARRAMVGRVPDNIRLRTERGMQAPDVMDWYREARTVEAIEDLNGDPQIDAFIDLSGLADLIRDEETEPTAFSSTSDRAVGIAAFIRWYQKLAT